MSRRREHHVQEILAVAQIIVWINERLTHRLLVAVSRNRRQLGEQSIDRNFDLVGVVQIHRVLIERRQSADHTAEDRHRVSVAGKPVVERSHVLVDHRVVTNSRSEFGRLLCVGQFAIDQQVGGFEKVGLSRKLLDRVATISQDPLFAIEKGDRAAGAASIHETFIKCDQPCLASQAADVDRSLAFTSLDNGKLDFSVAVDQLDSVGLVAIPGWPSYSSAIPKKWMQDSNNSLSMYDCGTDAV